MADEIYDLSQAVVYDEPRPAPLRAARTLYYGRADDALFGELQDTGLVPFSVIVYADWRGPQRAASLYYRNQVSEIPGGDDAASDQLIVAYQESWALSPGMLRLYTQTAQDFSVAPEVPVDPSAIIGRWRPARYRMDRSWYRFTAQDIGEPTVEPTSIGRYRPIAWRLARGYLYWVSTQDGSDAPPEGISSTSVIGMRYRPARLRPLRPQQFAAYEYGAEFSAPPATAHICFQLLEGDDQVGFQLTASTLGFAVTSDDLISFTLIAEC